MAIVLVFAAVFLATLLVSIAVTAVAAVNSHGATPMQARTSDDDLAESHSEDERGQKAS
jgi:hypothetical protein